MNERYVRPAPDRVKKMRGRNAKPTYGSMLMELEQRIAFDAAGAATVEKSQEKSQQDQTDRSGADAVQRDTTSDGRDALVAALAERQAASAPPEGPATSAVSQPRQVVVIDSSVPDYEALVKDLGDNFKVVVVDANENGVRELADTLSSMQDVEAIHIISHGKEGFLQLGSASLTATTMATDYAADLTSLRDSLSDDADILVYGCNFAEGDGGTNAVKMLGYLTGADIAASTDPTGSAALGGNWDLEYRDGDIASDVIGTERSQADFAETLNVATSNGNGALLVSAGRSIYSVDVLTGKATMITTVPTSVGGITVSNTINSLAADQTNGLIYYVDSSTDPANKALFAYDYINNTHILVDSDLTTGATTNIVTGTTGVGGGAATFFNGGLYLGVENITGSNDQIYRITFSNNGRTMAGATAFGAQITTANDWGDFAIDATSNALLSINASTITRYNLANGAIIDSFTNVGGSTGAQGGGDINGNTYLVGTDIRQINPTTGAAIGSAVTITTNGTTALTGISDAARWTPPTGTIGDKIFNDVDKSGTFNTGDGGIGGVTVQLIDDVNGDGLVSTGERILATDTTDANGNYLFTGVLPGQYIVRVTDANGVLGTATLTTASTTQAVTLATIGATNLAADFGYYAQPPVVDLNSGTTPTQIITNGGTPGTTGWTIGGTGATANDGFAWTLNGGTGTLTQANVSGWTDGLAPSGAAQLTFDVGWSNNLLLGISNDNNTPATLDVTIGGVLYARITTGTLNGTPNTATITYFNGASGTPSTVAASAAGTTAWGRTAVTINLPSTVVATGDLVFSYSAAGGLLTPSTDDIFIDNVSALRNVDTVAGVNYTTTYTENGAGVSIGSTATDVRDLDSTNMRSATIVLTNAQAGDVLTVGTLPSGITGSVDTTVAGQVTVTLTGSATKASYAAAIKAITFSNTGDNPSTTPRVVNVTVNDGGLSSAVATSTISVVAVNDAPVNNLPASWTTNEDTSLALTGLSVTDLDAGTGSMTVTLSVASGTITATAGGSVGVSGSGTGTVVLTGTLANINAYLASASAPVYVPVADANGTVVLTMTTNDNGNTGTGGALTDVDTRNIIINPVNDAPVLDLDGSTTGTGYSVGYTENATGVAISNTNSSVIDVDNANMASAAIVITNGQAGDLLTVTGTLPSGITASYNATTFTLTLSGSATKAAYETALRQLLYTSSSDNPTLNGAAASRNISVTVNDGAANSNTAVTAVSITAVNDAPVNTLPVSWTTNEDTSVALTGLSITDPDAGTGSMTVRLQVPTGVLTATAGGSVTVSGSGTGTLVLTGTLANLNAYLASSAAPVYVPVADANGSVTVTMTTSDLGNFGTGGPLTDTDTAVINITPVNDAPILDLDASGAGTGFTATYTENDPGVAIADTDGVITDIDSANMASLSAVITNGQAGDILAVAGTLPSGITASYNAATFTLTLTGSAQRASYETALQQIRFLSSSENPSTTPRSINVTVNDGAANSNVAVAIVNVIAVNDAPVNTVPTSVTLNEDVQTAISGISVSDVDSGSVTVTLSVANGTLSPSVIAGTVTGNGTASVTVSGTLAQVNSVLASLRYTGRADYNGSDTLVVSTSDGSLTDTDNVAITVTPVADITPDTVATAEDTAITFNVITGTNGATADTFKDPGRAVTSVTQPPAGQGSVTFAADGTLVYTPAANFNGQTTFTYTVTSGGVTETATVTVNVSAVNDAPVNSLPASGWSTSEDTAIALSGLSISDVDAGTGTMTVTLAVSGGTVSASSGAGVTVSGSGSTSLTLSGTLSAINAYLASAAAPQFNPAANASGSVTLTMTTNDGGNTGSGGALTDVDTRTITIDPVNDAPVNTLPAGGWSVNEDTALALTGLAISDVDAGSGTMTVVLGVNSGQLTAVSGSGVTISGSGTSSLTLSGTLASINAYLASTARPVYTPVADFNGAVTLTMTTNDGGNTGSGGALTDVDTATITVIAVNDAPTLDLDTSAAGTGYATSYTENAAGVAIVNTGVLVADVDNANMASATIIISNGQAGDVLAVTGTLPSGITASYNASTFTLTLTGSATKAAYQTALGQIRYASTSDDPGAVTRSINVTVSDGAASSNTAVTTVAVTPVNDAPVNTLPTGGWTVGEDGTLSLTGLSVADPDIGSGTATVTLSVGSGVLTAASGSGVTVTGSGTSAITLSGTLSSINAYLASTARPTYAPVADFNGSVTLTMTSSDGQLTDTDTQTISVTAVADIANDTATTNEDTAVVIAVDANDSFENAGHTITAINGSAIVTNGVVNVASGTVRLNADGTLTFTPSVNVNGSTSFTYTVTSGGVTETATVNVTIVPVNDAPVNTVPGAQTVAEDTPLVVSGVSVADVDGDALTTTVTVTNGIANVTTGTGATIANNGTSTVRLSGTAAQINAALAGLTYTATADYNGAAQLTIQTTDGTLTDTDTVAISITPVADIVADNLTTNEDTALTFNAITGTNGASADNFENAGRAITSVTQPPAGQGTVTFAADGTITYTPAANFNGTTSFTYTVTSGGVTETATVTIVVNPVNDAPVNTVPPAQTTAEDTSIVFSSSGGNAIVVSDVDNGTLTVTVTVTNGSFSLSGISGLSFSAGDGTADQTMTFTGTTAAINTALAGASYAPVADYNGTAQISVQTSDGSLNATSTIPVTITPVADIANDSVSTDEDVPAVISVLANDSFENPARAITAVNGTAITAGGAAVTVANGTVRLNASSQLIFTPTLDYNGVTTFTYTVTSGGVTETAQVSVAVASVNTPPVNTLPPSFTAIEDTSLGLAGLQISDQDAGSGTMTVTLSVNSGVLSALGAGGVTVNGSGSQALTLSGTLADINAYLAGATRPSFTPSANSTASVTLTMTTNDNGNTGGPSLVDIDTATIAITSVNDAPAGTDNTVTINEDSVYTFSAASFGFTDPNDSPANSLAAVVITTLPTNGVLSLGGTAVTAGQVISAANLGNLTFTPSANANGTALASFTFQVRDNGGTANGGQDTDQSPNNFTFNVTAVNDAPVNTLPASFGTNEDTALSLAGLQVTDVDAGSGAIRVTLSVNSGTLAATGASGVTVSGSGSGTLVLTGTLSNINGFLAAAGTRPVFNPAANANGAVTLTMVTNDNGNTGSGGALSDTDTATISVAPVNDAPVGSDTAITTNEDTAFSGTLPVATDVDGDSLTYGAGSIAPSHGTVVVNPNGTYTYTPSANFNGTDSFTYSVTDGTATVQYLVSVTVNSVNDAPVGVNDTAQTNAGVSTSLNVLANDTDVDGDVLQVSAINGVAGNVGLAVTGSNGGTFTIGANGAAVFNPGTAFTDLPAGQSRTSSVTYQLSDGRGGFSTATVTVTVTGVNDAPISTPIANQTGNDAQSVTLNVAGNFSDPDTGDTLTFTATGLPSGLTINATTGVISGTINRSASVNGPYAVTVTATDGSGATANRSFTWAVLNPPPVAAADNLATTENSPLTGSVFVNNGNGVDTDPDGDPISVSAVGGSGAGVGQAVAGSNGGTFTINADGTYAFNPGTAFDDLAAGATRVTTVTYTITDGQGGFSTATVTVTVTGLNDAPVAVADSFTTNEDTSVTFDVRANDSDVDGGTLGVTAINGTAIVAGGSVAVTGGVVTLNADGRLTFTPTADYNGRPTFTYTISDGQGGTASATVTGTVNPVQDPPVAANDSFTTDEDTAVTFDVRTNDGDVDGDALAVIQINGSTIASGGSVAVTGGSVRLNADGTLTFTPAANYNGNPSFSYTISDGHGGTATATVNGTVNPVQDPPVAQGDSFTTPEDQAVTIAVLNNDSDPDGDALTITQINGTGITAGRSVAITGGIVTLNANGTLTFTPTANFNGSPSFTYTVSDGNGGSATATVSGTVTPVNDIPVAVADSFTTPEDTAVTFDVLGNDSDVDGDTLTVTAINGANIAAGGVVAVTGGTVRLNANGTLTFTPTANFNGSPSFTYTISDGNGGTATATVSGSVTPVNDAPVAVNDSFTTLEDTAVTFDVRGNDSDVDGDALNVTAINGTAIVSGGSVAITGGSVRLNANGTLTFTSAANYNGTPSFTYTISDGNGGTATATVNGTVTPVNDAPVASDTTVSVDEDGVISSTLPAATDVDGDAITYAAGSTTPAHGTVVVNPNGTYSYTPSANFNGTDRFTYVVSDGKGGSNEYTVTVNVASVNDAPVGTPLPARSGADGAAVSFDVSGFFSDADNDTLTYSSSGLPVGLSINAAGVVTGTIDRQASVGGPTGNGVYTVTVSVSDGRGGTASQSFSFSVSNPPPVAVNDAVTATEDTPLTFNVLDGTASGGVPDSDPDGDPLTVTAASAANGTVTLGTGGQITYQPNANFNGTDTITYTISDGNGGTATATVTVTVLAVNDAPVGQPIADRTRNDGDTDSLNISAFFSDADGDPLTYAASGLPAGLTIDPATGLVSGRIAPEASARPARPSIR
ncbi:tandem-95 repeat protein [Rhizobium sp. AN80A]|uniref:tandem-95 repeat protein n=1 Tax=Rhizobium sp. AN80A TaxID=3040673 RepID=UPI0024B3206F|nr:tandem-95 repeat protein [Rhizobium sp. AN80A]